MSPGDYLLALVVDGSIQDLIDSEKLEDAGVKDGSVLVLKPRGGQVDGKMRTELAEKLLGAELKVVRLHMAPPQRFGEGNNNLRALRPRKRWQERIVQAGLLAVRRRAAYRIDDRSDYSCRVAEWSNGRPACHTASIP